MPRILLGIPVYEAMKPRALMAQIDLQKQAEKDRALGQYSLITSVIGPRTAIRTARNEFVRIAENMHATHLMFLDDDIMPLPWIISDLLAVQKPIVGGLIKDRDGNWCVFAHDVEGNLVRHQNPADNGPFKCASVGTGAMIVDMEVFKALSFPWFYYERSPYTMDTNFCLNAGAAGFEVWCHGKVRPKQLTHREEAC